MASLLLACLRARDQLVHMSLSIWSARARACFRLCRHGRSRRGLDEGAPLVLSCRRSVVTHVGVRAFEWRNGVFRLRACIGVALIGIA